MTDSATFNYAVLAMEVAERGGDAIFAGPDGNGVFDAFNALTYVDVANALNLDTSTAGVLKRGSAGASVPALATNADSGSAATYVNRTNKFLNGGLVTHIAVNIPNALASFKIKIVHRTGAASYTCVYEQTVSHPGGGSVSFALTTPYTIPGSGDYYPGVYWPSVPSGNGRINPVARAVLGGVDVTGSTTSLAEDSGKCPSLGFSYGVTGDLEVQSTTLAMSADPDWGQMIAFISGSGVNTDLIASLSRDDGVTPLDVPLTEKYTRPDGSKVYDSGEVDLTGEPSGSTGRWLVRTENAPTGISVHAVGVLFGTTP
jgi:hypothetical protein